MMHSIQNFICTKLYNQFTISVYDEAVMLINDFLQTKQENGLEF